MVACTCRASDPVPAAAAAAAPPPPVAVVVVDSFRVLILRPCLRIIIMAFRHHHRLRGNYFGGRRN